MTYLYAILGLALATVIWFLIQRAGQKHGTSSCGMPGHCRCGRPDPETCPEKQDAHKGA